MAISPAVARLLTSRRRRCRRRHCRHSHACLQVTEKAQHYGIAKLLPEPVDPAKDLVLQFDLKLTSGLSCGGAYIKFVTADATFTPAGLKDDTPYPVMFGPDKCGATNKVCWDVCGVLL